MAYDNIFPETGKELVVWDLIRRLEKKTGEIFT